MEQDRTGRNEQKPTKGAEVQPSQERQIRTFRDLDLGGGVRGGHWFSEPPIEGSLTDRALKAMDRGMDWVMNKFPTLGKLADKIDELARPEPLRQSREQRPERPSEIPPSEPPTQR
jgi:hypothetical protein